MTMRRRVVAALLAHNRRVLLIKHDIYKPELRATLSATNQQRAERACWLMETSREDCTRVPSPIPFRTFITPGSHHHHHRLFNKKAVNRHPHIGLLLAATQLIHNVFLYEGQSHPA